MAGFVDQWRTALRVRGFRDRLLLSIAGLVAGLILLLAFLNHIETRRGVPLPDPLLSLFSPVDLNWITFSLTYSGILLGFASLSLYPYALLLALRAFIGMILLRIGCLYLLHLDPPENIIPLIDPFIQWDTGSRGFTRDLFFSGGVATMALFAFTAQWRDLRIIFTCAGAAVSVLLLLQHAHYTIDVLAAPCFAYVAYGIGRRITMGEVRGTPG